MVIKKLYLARHGETGWNRAGRYQGHEDVHLSPLGRRQADRLGQALVGTGVDAIHTSDLARARETAERVGRRLGLAVQVHPGLREMAFGAWEGLTFAQAEERYPEAVRAYRHDPHETVLPGGGESFAQVITRVSAAWEELITGSSARTLLLVAHGGTLKALLCHLLGFDPRQRWRFVLDNGSLTLLRWTGRGPRLHRFNDTAHLHGLNRGTGS